MSDEDTLTPTPPSTRAGTGADLARRMDRMETRQDSIETEVRNLAATVLRVESNQNHAEELNKLRFGSLETKIDATATMLAQFITRIDGIISGEVDTLQARQGREMVADYMKWREKVEEHIDNSNLIHQAAASQREGVGVVLTGTKAVILTIAAVVSPLVAIIVALSH